MEKQNKLNPAGCILGDLVIEPLGDYNYLYKKGIIKVDFSDKEAPKLSIEDAVYYFTTDNIPKRWNTIILPSEESIEKWIKGKYNVPTTKELYKKIRNYLQVLLELPIEYYYDIATVLILQSWVIDLLDSCVFGGFFGTIGAGKTTVLESLEMITKHRWVVGDPSSASLARTIETYKLTVFADEIDSKGCEKKNSEDSEIYRIIRLSQRRGNRYMRCKPKTFEPEFFDCFGTKFYTVHDPKIETGLETRTLKIQMGKSDDKRLPIIDLYKREIGFPLFEDIFFWYMDNITKCVARVASVDHVDSFSDINQAQKSIKNLLALKNMKQTATTHKTITIALFM